MFRKKVKSAFREQTHIVMIVIGPDSQDISNLVRKTLLHENFKRSKQGTPRISYQIETAAG